MARPNYVINNVKLTNKLTWQSALLYSPSNLYSMEDTARLLNRAEGSQIMMPTRRIVFNQGLEAFTILYMNGNIYGELKYSATTVSIDLNGRVCGALVLFGCYQHVQTYT